MNTKYCKTKWVRANSPGFTLIEMLVVISIMALLSTFLNPAIQSALERARQAQCSSNLRELASAVHLFLVENNGRYPSYDLGSGENPRLWYHLLDQKYFGDSKGDVWQCPSNKDHVFSYNGLSYGYNANMGYYDGPNITQPRSPRDPVNSYQMVSPAKTILLADGEVLQPSYSSYMTGQWRTVGVIHRGGANIAYLDGHVDWHLQEEVTPDRNANNWSEEEQIRWGVFESNQW